MLIPPRPKILSRGVSPQRSAMRSFRFMSPQQDSRFQNTSFIQDHNLNQANVSNMRFEMK